MACCLTTQAITSITLILSSKVFCGIHLRPVSQEVLMNLIRYMCSEIAFLVTTISCRSQWINSWRYCGIRHHLIIWVMGKHEERYISLMYIAWWRHKMETFSALLAIFRGIHRSPVNSPHKGQWRGALMFSLICVWINDWINNREAGDLRRHRGHYECNVFLK